MKFFVGIHQPSDAGRVERACISINRLRGRRSAFLPPRVEWMMDSGAFTEVALHGGYRHTAGQFAADAARWATSAGLAGVVSQDFMCEPFVLQRTGLSLADHQRLTIERYDQIATAWATLAPADPPLIPVLQGFHPSDYTRHVLDYGPRLRPGMWVGVGSVCKRQGNPALVEDVLYAIREVRPDLRLHGFRREADRARAACREGAASFRRQHGLELRRSARGQEQQRLAGSGGVRTARCERCSAGMAAPPTVRTA